MSYSLTNAVIVAQASPVTAPGAAGDVAPAVSSGVDATAQAATQAASQAAQAFSAPAAPTGAAPDMGFMHFVMQSDSVGKFLFVALLVMSALSWYFIFVKSASNYRMRRRSTAFLSKFWNASSLTQVEQEIATHGAQDPFSHLTSHAIHAKAHHEQYGATKLEDSGSNNEFITRTMRKVMDEETSKLENGLTVLASIGSTAPFVGLFGTVWGVYHALVNIGMSDGVTINRIAGPVGEALIMTGLGLAVAIPAVLAYNAFVRSNRVFLGRLDAFAHDLFAFLSTGQQVAISDGKVRALRRSVRGSE